MSYLKLTLHPDTIARRRMWSESGRRRDTAAPVEVSQPRVADETDGSHRGSGHGNSAASSGSEGL